MPYPHAELKALIDSEPANAGRTDAQVLAWCDELTRDMQRDISGADFNEWLSSGLRRLKLKQAESGLDESGAPLTSFPGQITLNQVKNAALIAGDIAETGLGIELSRAGAASGLAPLRAIFTQAEIDELRDFGRSQVQRWQSADVPRPRLGDITAARAL